MNRKTSPLEQSISLTSSPVASRADPDPMARASVGRVRHEAVGASKKDLAVITAALVFVAVMGVLYLLQSAQITATAYSVHAVQATLERVEQENLVLKVEVAQSESLDRVEARAAALGMEKAQNTVFLRLDPTVLTPVGTGTATTGVATATAEPGR
jgi:cell division protein FtsL